MSSRSRSRSGSRSPKRYRRNIRDESISPIRTASGANLRTPKSYNSGGQGFRNYNYGYQQRNYNYNNRGYYNQRYNYGRWNRGRGNYRGQWNNRNQWNNRGRYNSRSERSRSRSRSYDSRDRSRSSSYSRSRSRSRSLSCDKDKRKRSRSIDRSKSRSKTPQKTLLPTKEEAPRDVPKDQDVSQVSIEMPVTQPNLPTGEAGEKEEEKQHFAETSAFTRSRWETPDASPDAKGKHALDMDLEQDKIFDQWDDDKLRAYLLKSKGKKLGKDVTKLTEGAEPDAPVQAVSKPKKKKKSKSNAESPTKEARGRKKKRDAKPNRSSSGSSSSSWSPIHKAPESRTKTKKVSPKPTNEYTPFSSEAQQTNEFTPATSQIYSQTQAYSISDVRTQAVQYPFSHIHKPPAPVSSEPVPAAPQQYQPPVPVPAPQPATPPSLGEMQVIRLDGTPLRLVPTSVPGPDGKMIQVMQIQPSVSAPPQQQPPAPLSQPKPPIPVSQPKPPMPVSQPKPAHRVPPPPPPYPPPGLGKYLPQEVPKVSASYEPQRIPRIKNEKQQTGMDKKPSYEKPTMAEMHSDVPPHVQVVKTVEQTSQESINHALSLKKMEMMEKQKRRQEVVRTRFKPRPAGAWAEEVKRESKEDAKEHGRKAVWGVGEIKQEVHSIPALGSNSNTTKSLLTSNTLREEYVGHGFSTGQKNATVANVMSATDLNIHAAPSQHMPETKRFDESAFQQPKVDNTQSFQSDAKMTTDTGYPPVPPQLAAQGFRPVQGNPQILVGPNGEMLQLISAPQPTTVPQRPSAPKMAGSSSLVPQRPPAPKLPDSSRNVEKTSNSQEEQMESIGDGLIHKRQEKPDARNEESSDDNNKDPSRKRTVSVGSEKKSKKKSNRSISTEETEEEEPVKRKKEKKKKKKNKKKKEDESGTPKEKKKKKKQKEKTEAFSLEHETIKSKKDLKAFEEVKKKSEDDGLIRSLSDDMPLSHVRAIVPRKRAEILEPLLRYVSTESHMQTSLATSYEDRFVSLFGSGEPEPMETVEEKIDITKKSVRKFKVNVKGTRTVTHMTAMSLSDRIKQWIENDEQSSTQKVSLNVSSLSKVSRSRSRSSSGSSTSGEKSKKKDRKKSSSSRSRSKSASLPLAYSGGDSKSERRDSPERRRSRSREYSDDDLRNDLERRKAAREKSGSRSRSRSYSPDDDRNRSRCQRQMYYNRNNHGYYYNNRGRGQFNRGYYQNYRGRGWYNNRGNFRGRWQNWNNQGWNNRNQNYRYQRYDNRQYRERSCDRDRSRSRSSDDSRSSRERDDRQENRKEDKFKAKTVEEQPAVNDKKEKYDTGEAASGNGNPNVPKQPSPAHWGHDMFEQHETEGATQ